MTHSLQVVPILLKHITQMSSIQLYIPSLADNQFSTRKSIQELIHQFPNGVLLLNPIDYMNIKDEQFKNY